MNILNTFWLLRLFKLSLRVCWHFDDVIWNVYHDHLFVGRFLNIHCMHMVSRRYEFVRDFSAHLIDGSVFHTFHIHIVFHCDESIDVDSKPIPLRRFCCSQNICMVVLWCGTFECDHSNQDEWWICDCIQLRNIRMVWCLRFREKNAM